MEWIKEDVMVEELDGSYKEYHIEYGSCSDAELVYDIRDILEWYIWKDI